MESKVLLEAKDSDSEVADDFVLLDHGDSDLEEDEKTKEAIYAAHENFAKYANLAILYKMWVAFSTLHLFFIPAVLGLILGHAFLFFKLENGSGQDEIAPVMVMFFGIALCAGLPLHISALGELEDALYGHLILKNVQTQTEVDSDGTLQQKDLTEWTYSDL